MEDKTRSDRATSSAARLGPAPAHRRLCHGNRSETGVEGGRVFKEAKRVQRGQIGQCRTRTIVGGAGSTLEER